MAALLLCATDKCLYSSTGKGGLGDMYGTTFMTVKCTNGEGYPNIPPPLFQKKQEIFYLHYHVYANRTHDLIISASSRIFDNVECDDLYQKIVRNLKS